MSEQEHDQSDDASFDEEPFDDQMWDIVCAKCGEESAIPFDPGEREAVFCHDCYKEDLKRRREDRERSSPRRKHGTRVAFRIECSECGAEDELDYVPKGVSMDEVLCTECFEAQEEGETRWKEVREHKKKEQKREWSFECDQCGRMDWLNFEPDEDREYLCTRCFFEHARPDPDRLKGKEAVSRGVYIRKKDDDE